MGTNRQPVSREDIEALWRSIEARAANPGFDSRAGLFGPSSITWRINRESALFLGAGRAALLQLAHPWVATALNQHSNLHNDPVARFHNTFRVVFTMIFGSLPQALTASRHLYQLHTRIQGALPVDIGAYRQGSHYEANELRALVWVFATLVESAVLAYECVLPKLSAQERETYYAESKTTGALFGIPPTALPETWDAFENYIHQTVASNELAVNEKSRAMAQRVLQGHGSWISIPAWYRALTAAWLPERLRQDFQIPFGDREHTAADRARRWLPRFYRRLPSLARFVGPYREAQSRLRGQPPGAFTRTSNRFWIGQPKMMLPKPTRS